MELAFEISKCPPKKFCQKLIRIYYELLIRSYSTVQPKLFQEKSILGMSGNSKVGRFFAQNK